MLDDTHTKAELNIPANGADVNVAIAGPLLHMHTEIYSWPTCGST